MAQTLRRPHPVAGRKLLYLVLIAIVVALMLFATDGALLP